MHFLITCWCYYIVVDLSSYILKITYIALFVRKLPTFESCKINCICNYDEEISVLQLRIHHDKQKNFSSCRLFQQDFELMIFSTVTKLGSWDRLVKYTNIVTYMKMWISPAQNR